MSNDYVNAPATRLLATNCVACGKPLLDSVSIEFSLGPECRKHFRGDLSSEAQKEANKWVYAAAIAAQQGKIQEVLSFADKIERECMMGDLASKIRERFTKAVEQAERDCAIVIQESGLYYRVMTPFRRGNAEAFKQAWRAIPGRRWDNAASCNEVPVVQKKALWGLLKEFFPGKYGKGPTGVFRVPGGKK